MTEQEVEQLAEWIVSDLFTNGVGQKAKRLVLELEDGRDGGGWGRGPAKDRIETILRSQVAVT